MRVDYHRITQEMYEPRNHEMRGADRALLVASMAMVGVALGLTAMILAAYKFVWPALARSLAQAFVDTLGMFRG